MNARSGLPAVLTFLASSSLAASPQENASPASSDVTPMEMYEELEKAYDDAYQEFLAAYRAAETDDERQKIYDARYPNANEFVGDFVELAYDHPQTEAALLALSWVVENASGSPRLNETLLVLQNDYLDEEELGPLAARLRYTTTGAAESFLRVLLEESPHRSVQGEACYALAFQLKRKERTARTMLESGTVINAGMNPELSFVAGADPDQLLREAEEYFQRTVMEYGDLPHRRGSLKVAAEGDLFEIRNLAIGQVAPEIQGEDVQGSPFKLSDYRGKVVVLDFWGDW